MTFLITDYGAIGDGTVLATASIQKAIDAAHAAGGGRVVVPPGRWLSGTLFLRSRTVFDIQPGATVVGSPRLTDYVAMTHTDGDRTPWHLFVVHGEEDVTLCGGGGVDGSGAAYWADAPLPGTWMLHKNNQRPSPLLDVRECKRTRVENLRFRNSPGWMLHFHHTERVWIRGVEIDNPLFGPNTDGVDISGCSDVMISDCLINAADDAIVAFSSFERACERVTVTNCTLRSNCVAFKAYLFPGHDVRDLVFSNSVVFETNRAVGLYGCNTGTIENVLVSNVVCDTNCEVTFTRPIHIDAICSDKARGTVRNVQVSNMVCRTDGRILLLCQPGAVVENVVLRDVRMHYPVLDDPRPYGGRGKTGDQGSSWSREARVAPAAVVVEGVTNLVVDNLMIDWPKGKRDETWINKPRAGNGTHDMFPPPPEKAPAFQAVWGRRLKSGSLRVPLAKASVDGMAALNIEDSDIAVVG